MPVVSAEKLIALQRNADHVRNFCILAHVVSILLARTLPSRPHLIVAVQDHGKTSLSDSLIATNGIISQKSAGKVRYLDSRPDEQLRGITMESSAISLYFSMLRRSSSDEEPHQPEEYLINLIDSPGHIDFSSEVSTASRLCDGALVLVDAVEGVCSQTVTVLRRTWTEHLQPLLVINKMDRLITELKMTPAEAYTHLSKLLEQINAVVGSFFQGERMEEDLKWRERMEERVAAAAAKEAEKANRPHDADDEVNHMPSAFQEKDDEDIYFAPEKNNVIFSSATDGWAFTVRQFAALYEKKLKIKRATLEKILWGDYYLEPKTRRILGQKHLKGRALKPMFVQLVLDNIWAIYDATIGRMDGKGGDPAMATKILTSLSISLPTYVLRSKDARMVLTSIFAAWLPLSTAVLVSAIEFLPSPPAAQAARFPAIIDASPGARFVDPHVREAMTSFRNGKGDPVVAYVSKMVAVPESQLPTSERRAGGMTAEEAREASRRKRAEIARRQALSQPPGAASDVDGLAAAVQDATLHEAGPGPDHEAIDDPEHLIGFARLYSGTLAVGDEVYVLSPKFSPARPEAAHAAARVTITGLYLIMGRSLEPLERVPAGVVFGVAGLAGHLSKSGTLCSQVTGAVNLAGLALEGPPIVRVALEPANPADLDKMVQGLQLLVQSDPAAEYEVLENGEHVIATAGELHLERCLKDLRERFARCEIQAGEPIVPYRETIVATPDMAPARHPDLPRGTVVDVTASKLLTVRLRVRPLPVAVTEFLERHAASIRPLSGRPTAGDGGRPEAGADDEGRHGLGPPDAGPPEAGVAHDDGDEMATAGGRILSRAEFRQGLKDACQTATADREDWDAAMERITAFGPRRVGANVLIDLTPDGVCRRFLPEHQLPSSSADRDADRAHHPAHPLPRDLSDQILYAFQLATAQGPLCHEPMHGVAVFLEDVSLCATPATTDGTRPEPGTDHHDPPPPSHHPAAPLALHHASHHSSHEALKTVRDSIRHGFLDWSPRLLLAMYSCEIQASSEVLGRVYGVLTRRRGRILAESVQEGTPFFTILALLPVAECFGFSDEMRTRTSGAASPQLRFAGFQRPAFVDLDPFWVPTTADEIEDLGRTADRENVAKRYMDRVRTRKGLFVTGRKLVRDAEKQKTLKR
ncbi:MAG: Cytoplasmic GTPase/eEF2-like protein (ribosomal biogenesis) [Phylliscum demangeonii]|nr:MAG: Cytoplasmic GTPase/eEF2-like protein (ribosomal biogenesis) [Phylliscum demangeonii]